MNETAPSPRSSALALKELLQLGQNKTKQEERFLSVVAMHLDNENPPRELFVLCKICKLIEDVHMDIENLPFEPTLRNHYTEQMKPFEGLRNFKHAQMTVKQAEQQFLKPEHISGLVNIHGCTALTATKVILSQDFEDLASEFLLIRGRVAESRFSDRFKRLLLDRIDQITILMKNSSVFDTEDLQREYEALAGALVVSNEQKSKDQDGTFDRILNLVGKGLTLLKTVDGGLGSVISISEKAQEFLGYVDNSDSDNS